LREKRSQHSEKAKNSKFLNDFCDFSCMVQKKVVTLQGFWGKGHESGDIRRDHVITRLRDRDRKALKDTKNIKITRRRDYEITRSRHHEATKKKKQH